MNRPVSLVFLTAAIVGLLAVVATTVGQSQTTGAAGTGGKGPFDSFAVLDLVSIFNDAAQIKDLNDQINKKQTEVQAEAQQRAKSIESKQVELSAFKPGTDDYERRRKELLRLNVEANVWLKSTEQDLELQKFNWTRIVYEKACETAAAVAQERGYSMVLQRKDFKPGDIEQTVQAMRRMIQERDVLYHAPQSDITSLVLHRLDQDYKAAGGAKQLSVTDDDAPLKPFKTP